MGHLRVIRAIITRGTLPPPNFIFTTTTTSNGARARAPRRVGPSNEAARVIVEWALVARGTVLHCLQLPSAQSCVGLHCDDVELASGDRRSCGQLCCWSGCGSCMIVDITWCCILGCRRCACPTESPPARRNARCEFLMMRVFFCPVDICRGHAKTPPGAFSNSGSPTPRPQRQGQAAGPSGGNGPPELLRVPGGRSSRALGGCHPWGEPE